MHYCTDVKAFHDKFGLKTPSKFTFIPEDLHHFRSKFFHEELTEFFQGVQENDLAGAIDALIDLVYITCGCALLYGIQPEEFTKMAKTHEGIFTYHFSNVNFIDGPHLLDFDKSRELYTVLAIAIIDYECGYDQKDEEKIKNALTSIYVNCLFGANDMGFTPEMWDELWADVQKCNLSKERAKKASDSKRGSDWDVVKPSGWIAPQTEALVKKFVSQSNI
jgi:hypothetical protein